jgi:hypothetical protein
VIRPGQVILLLAVLSFATAARAQIDPAQFRKDLEAIASSPSRTIGSPGYFAAAEYLQGQI